MIRAGVRRARGRRIRDLALAAAAGSGAAALVFAVLTRPNVSAVRDYYVANSLEAAGGRNVVNVILVDFRGLDTFGEIAVVAIVAIIVYSLLRRFRPAPESIAVPISHDADPAPPVTTIDDPLPRNYMKIPAVLVRLLGPMAAMVSVYLLLRGHNSPGGGFVGGLVMATAIIIQYMVGGTMWVEARLRIHPQLWVALGLLAAGGAGILAWFAEAPFLTALTLDLHLPLLGDLHLSSALLFDLGVYMVVIGSVVLMLVALAHQSMRSSRRAALVEPTASDTAREVSA